MSEGSGPVAEDLRQVLSDIACARACLRLVPTGLPRAARILHEVECSLALVAGKLCMPMKDSILVSAQSRRELLRVCDDLEDLCDRLLKAVPKSSNSKFAKFIPLHVVRFVVGFSCFLFLLESLKFQSLNPLRWVVKGGEVQAFRVLSSSQSWGALAIHKTSDGRPILIDGQRFKGFGTHAKSEILVQPKIGKGQMTGACGYPDYFSRNEILCTIEDEGAVLFSSPVLNARQRLAKFRVPVEGLRKYRLSIKAINGASLKEAHGAWVDLQLSEE